jgi:hypothetical protein
MCIVFEDFGFAVEDVLDFKHAFGEAGVVDAMFDAFEVFVHIESFGVEFDHISVVLQCDDIERELATGFLFLVFVVVGLADIALDVLQKDVDIEIFHEVAITQLLQVGISGEEFVHAGFASFHYVGQGA